MKGAVTYRLLLSIGLLIASPVSAQITNAVADQVPFFAAALSQFLSDTRSFSARAELQLPASATGESVKLSFNAYIADGRMRWDLDLNQKSSTVDADFVSMLQQFKLDRVNFVLRPETNALIVVPGLKAYVEPPMPRAEPVHFQAQEKIEKLQKTLIGNETVDGVACQKFKLSLPEQKGQAETAIVWQAPALNDLPIKMQIRLGKDTYTLKLRNIRMGKQEDRIFGPPAGFTKYATVEALMQAALSKGLGIVGSKGGKSSDDANPLGALIEALR